MDQGRLRKALRMDLYNWENHYALRLLRETDWSIAEVAEMVGYANPGHFSVAFREKFAMTLGDYKKIVRSER